MRERGEIHGKFVLLGLVDTWMGRRQERTGSGSSLLWWTCPWLLGDLLGPVAIGREQVMIPAYQGALPEGSDLNFVITGKTSQF